MRPYHYAGAPPRKRPINEDELVRDLRNVCRYVLGAHPIKRRPPSRVRQAARTVLWCGSPGELSAVLDWLSHAPSVPSDVGASCWALGEEGEPFEFLLKNLDRFAQRLRADAMAVA